VKYNEGVLVGYRWYDTKQIEPLYPFGHGLSYTRFDYQKLNVEMSNDANKRKVKVSCEISNVGAESGAETVQLYVSDKQSSVTRPVKELKGFEKIVLNAGDTQKIEFTLVDNDFAFYDTGSKSWVVEPGEFEIMVGTSSRQIKLQQPIIIE
jgi:beta-glucosidase